VELVDDPGRLFVTTDLGTAKSTFAVIEVLLDATVLGVVQPREPLECDHGLFLLAMVAALGHDADFCRGIIALQEIVTVNLVAYRGQC